ncbi:MAG: DUF4384 domain-containing protein [Deltaproteobacteria bacterium]|nr:DUF4384 domain-containing protein [Deltaproteobacteria bacterium]
MDKDFPIIFVESLLKSRPGYRLFDDCPHTQEIAIAVAEGMSLAELTDTFPHLQTCALCRESVKMCMAIDDNADESDFHAGHTIALPPPSRLGQRMRWALAALLLAGLAGGMGLLVWQSKTRESNSTTSADNVMTPKGAAYDLEIAVSRNGAGFQLEQGDMVETGDHLGFFYSATQRAHLALFHLNAHGELSTLFPARTKYSAPVKDGARIPIKDGAVATPATTCEWVVAVFTEKVMSINTLRQYLSDSAIITDKTDGCDLRIGDKRGMTIKIQQIRR